MRLDDAVRHLEDLGYEVRFAFNPSPGEEVRIIHPNLRGRKRPTVVMANEPEYVICRGFVDEAALMVELRQARIRIRDLTLQSKAADLVIELLEDQLRFADEQEKEEACGCGSPRCEVDVNHMRAAGL